MAAENGQDTRIERRRSPRFLPRLGNHPIQVVVPTIGKKFLGFLLDESVDGVAIHLRRTSCLARGDRVQISRNGSIEEATVKNFLDRGVSLRIGLEWVEPFDYLATVGSFKSKLIGG